MFPPSNNAAYRGSVLALWLFIPILLMKTVIAFNIAGFNPMVSARNILETVDGVPLSSYPNEAVGTIVTMANAWGLAMLVLCVACWLVALRYRLVLPLAILALLIEQTARKLMTLNPGEPMAAGAWINWGFTGVLLLAFLLSLLPAHRNAPS